MLIFEDDVVLRPRFTEKLEAILKAADELPPGWLIYLGGRDTRVPDAFFLNRNLLFPLPMATADGYLTDAAAISKRLEWLSAHKALFGADHLLHRVDPACHIQNYWPKEALVEQGSVFGLFDTKLDAGRAGHSAYYNWLRYHWKIFQRRTLKGMWVKTKAHLGLK